MSKKFFKVLKKKIYLLFSPTCEICSSSKATDLLEIGKEYTTNVNCNYKIHKIYNLKVHKYYN